MLSPCYVSLGTLHSLLKAAVQIAPALPIPVKEIALTEDSKYLITNLLTSFIIYNKQWKGNK